MSDFGERLDGIQRRLDAACVRTGRAPGSAGLVAVSKTFGPEAVTEAAGFGVRVFGENRVQEARHKIPECPGHLEWHLVGHLQRNKAREAVRMFRMIHSVDSVRLLEAIEAAASETGDRIRVCLEVNVAGEGSKFGFVPGEVTAALARCGEWPHVDIVGLMTVPPITEDPEGARPHFRRLRECRDAWAAETGMALPELSMGMSHDFEVAVEEGATLVRLGTILFGKRVAPRGEGVHDDA